MYGKIAFIVLLLSSLLFSCAGGAGGDASDSTLSDGDSGGNFYNVSYEGIKDISSGASVIEVPMNASSWEFEAEEGKYVYFVRTNTTSSVIPQVNVQNISFTQGIDSSARNISVNPSGSVSAATGYGRSLDFVKPHLTGSSSRSVSRGVIESRTKDWNYGDEREINLEDGKGNFTKKKVRLFAKDRYCYVWCAVSESSNMGFSQFSSVCDVFDEICLPVIFMSGSPSDSIMGGFDGRTLVPVNMEGFSYTGNKVNIVIYDIGDDGANGEYIGFFSSRDYYPDSEDLKTISGKTYSSSDSVFGYSNEGKYLYIDSWFLKNKYGTALSTLAHEFHHMIIYGNKVLKNGKILSVCWNEMLSMMCEDLMNAKIKSIDTSFRFWDSPVQRLPYFNRMYANAGLEMRNDSQNTVVFSYSTLYAFGAWLLRNFGGSSLLSRMARSSSVDETMILEAVNSLNGTSYSMENLVGMFAVSCVASDYGFSLNKEIPVSAGYSYNGYTFTSLAIDLWHFNQSDFQGLNSGYTSYKGPLYIDASRSADLRPYGFLISYLGKSKGGKTKVFVGNSSVSRNMRMYLVLSDKPPVT